MMKDWSLSKVLMRDLMKAAHHVHPYEFIALLSMSNPASRCVDEFVVVPAEYGLVHSSLRADLIPKDDAIVGTVHSHPSPSTIASSADRSVFARLGVFHLILGYPYAVDSFAAYDAKGTRLRPILV